MECSLIISFIIAICYGAPCFQCGDGGEGQQMEKRATKVKARHTNSNEEWVLRYVYLIPSKVRKLLDDYLSWPAGCRFTLSHSCGMLHVINAEKQTNNNNKMEQKNIPLLMYYLLHRWYRFMNLCIRSFVSSLLNNDCSNSCLLRHWSRRGPELQQSPHKNMSTPLIMKIGRLAKHLCAGASCSSSRPWQNAQLDLLSMRTDKEKQVTHQKIIREIYFTFTNLAGRKSKLKAQLGSIAGVWFHEGFTNSSLSTGKVVYTSW